MKKLVVIAVVCLMVIGAVHSCKEPDTVTETQQLYGVDKDKAVRPGNGGN